MFQSLLCWISVIGIGLLAGVAGDLDVSILVVLDLGHGGFWSDGIRPREFVSILVVLDLGHRLSACCPTGRAGHGFQSLLCWISVIGRIHVTTIRSSPRRSFNPCCVGSRSSATPDGVDVAAECCFNPCCVGSRSSAGVGSSWDTDTGCFNPCCVGSRSSAAHAVGRDKRLKVSILVVLDLGHRQGSTVPPGSHRIGFQSLLCWISVIGAATERGRCRIPVFQSLLCWISVIGTARRPGGDRQDRVSILVVLDLGHRHAGDALVPAAL